MIISLNYFSFNNQVHSSAMLIKSAVLLLPAYKFSLFSSLNVWCCHMSRSPWGLVWCLSLLLSELWLNKAAFLHLRFSASLLLKGPCLAWYYPNSFFLLSVVPLMDITLYSLAWENLCPLWSFLTDMQQSSFSNIPSVFSYGILLILGEP